MGLLGLLPGCDDVKKDAFGGLIGVVGQPAISNCTVDIYDAIAFQSLDSAAGRIRSGTSRSNGRFAIELKDKYLGRPLIVVARPGPGAMYRDFGAPGNPDVTWDAPHEPWVSIVTEWRGGERYCAINPITTVAFHSQMRISAEDTGAGDQRFARATSDGVQQATAANFGIAVIPSSAGITPPKGSPFASLSTFYLEDSDRGQSYAYACLQLALAANDFANLSASGTDNALDFYDAMFRDAHDGALDGQYFGAPVPHLNQLPGVIGRGATGESNLLNWLSGHALTPAQEDFLNNARDDDGFEPAPTTMLGLQSRATGSLRPTRIDSCDVQNYPYSGNVVLTLRGDGLRYTDRFVFRSNTKPNGEFHVDRDSVGVDGEFQYLSNGELRMRIPDFASTTRNVPSELQVASGTDFRIVTFVLENVPGVESGSGDVEHVITTDARLTDRTEPLLLGVQIGRLDGVGALQSTAYGNNVYSAATDPDALTPGTDNVYEMSARVVNPGNETVNGVQLDIPLSAFSQLGASVDAEFFTGAPAGTTAVVFGNVTPVNLAPGAVVDFNYRVVFLDSAIPGVILEGAAVKFTPVFSGVGATSSANLSTGDVIGFNRSVNLGPGLQPATPLLDALAAPSLPAGVTAGDSFEIRFDVSASPTSGGVMRSFNVTDLDVTITFDGATTTLRLTDSFFEASGESGLYFPSLVLDSTGGTAMPVVLTQTAAADAVILTVRTDPARTGTLTVDFTATGHDVATGATSTQSSATSNTTIS
ncbi:MAG: hypothetical protein K8I27_12800 [Planctomycetes bacterium]|nr:hypothetical protein [Planctomycetota bacterium]